MQLYKRIEENYSTDIGEFTINGEKRYMPMLFIPYSVWSNGNIDWTDENLTKLHKAIMEFIASDLVVFDCKKFMENL
jgi:hypothetical protein